MGPGLIGQLNSSMQQGVPEPGQVSGTSPNFQPGLMPPLPPPTPEKSPASEIHKTIARGFARHGRPVPPQIQAMMAQAPQNAPMGQPSAPQAGAPMPTPQQPEIPLSEAELIIKALTTRLGHHSKIEQKVADALLPQPDLNESPTAGESAALQ